MEKLLNFQKTHNITDKDLFVLSFLSSQLKESSLLEKQKINSKVNNILSKYGISFLDKVKIVTALKDSTYHENSELIGKYSDAHNSEEYEVTDKNTNKKNLIIFIAVFAIVFFTVTIILNNKSHVKDNSSISNDVTNVNGTYTYSDNSAELNVTVSGNMWSFKSTIKSGFGSGYDNDNSDYDSGLMKENDLYDKSGTTKIGYVNGNSLTTTYAGRQVTLNKN